MVSAYVGEGLAQPDRSGIGVDTQFVDKLACAVVEETQGGLRHACGIGASGFELETVLHDPKYDINEEARVGGVAARRVRYVLGSVNPVEQHDHRFVHRRSQIVDLHEAHAESDSQRGSSHSHDRRVRLKRRNPQKYIFGVGGSHSGQYLTTRAVWPTVALLVVALLVQKFGGTSVGDPDRIREVADYVARSHRRGDQIVLVASAMGKETDELLRLAKHVSGTQPGREMDMLITGGERKACALVSMALHDLGIESDSFTGSQAGFLTDSTHQNAKILELRPDRIREALDAGRIPVVGGSQGVSTDNNVTFLGRGGSDTTAVALAHALDADACELYTDVPGVFTTDPRLVANAQRIDQVSFDELLEMTATGCPKPAMRSVELARAYGVKLHVRSAFSWVPGTWVTEEGPMEGALISAVTHDTSEAKMTVSGVIDRPGVAALLFRTLANADVNVDMIVQNVSAQGHTDISFTVPHDQVEAATEAADSILESLGAAGVVADDGIARVSLIGAGMKTNPGVAATMFETLSDNDINIEMISTSAIRVSCVVRESQVERAVAKLHAAFELHIAPEDRSHI